MHYSILCVSPITSKETESEDVSSLYYFIPYINFVYNREQDKLYIV